MEHLTFVHVILAFLGIFLHILIKVQGRKKAKLPFALGIWIQENWLNTLISLVTLIALLMTLPDYADILGLKWGNALAFFSGYFTDSIFRNLIKFYNNKFKGK